MKNDDFHIDFKINDTSFESKEALLDFSKSVSTSVYNFFTEWFNEHSFMEIKTSGSTGLPKFIRIKKMHMIHSALATGQFFELKEKTTALLCLSTEYIAGKMMLLRAMILGWHLDIIEANSHPLDAINKKYDFCAMVPMQLYNSFDKIDFIDQLIVGGGVISNEYIPRIHELSTKIFATYGMTETITHIAVKKLNNFRSHEGKLDPPYEVLPSIKVSKNSRGCLVIDAPKIADKPIKTNDLIEQISNTKFHWLGRLDNIINSGGVKLIPEQIEKKLSKIIDFPFFVIGVTDPYLGEKLTIVIESAFSDTSIIDTIKESGVLEQYEVPKNVLFSDTFLRTETRKIKRKETLQAILEAKGES